LSFLELRALSKVYPDGTRAVDAIELDIAQGEFIVLLGPSGCGKTTTLRMIAGLESATTGRIALAGRDVTRLRAAERDIGFVFQFYALYPHMSVAENIEFPLACAGMSHGERHAQVARVAASLGIEPLLALRPRQLSGGDQQRVALARAMVRSPAVYLMDEPLGTLDAHLRLEMCEFLRDEQQSQRITTVYVTHDQEEAMRLADRVVVMANGRILQVGSPTEVYDRPSDLFVARFVGSPGMNFLGGTVVPGESGQAFQPTGASAAVPIGSGHALGAATLGVRPEYVRIEAGAPLRGRVVADEYLGSTRCVHVELGGERLVVRRGAREAARVGDELPIGFDPARVRLFDADTGVARP
jgi:multiple sugar transport system ATP-binding protein